MSRTGSVALDGRGYDPEDAIEELGEKIFHTLGDALPIGLFRTTPDTSGRLLAANPTFLKMLGYSSLAEIGQSGSNKLNADPGKWQNLCDRLLSTRSVSGIELEFKRKDGGCLWGAITARVISSEVESSPQYFDCALEDVTERKQVEETLRQRAAELASLHAISLDITSAHAYCELTDIIVSWAAYLMKVDYVWLALSEAEGPDLRVAAESNQPGCEATREVIHTGEGVAGTVALSGKALLVNDTSQWPGNLSGFEKRLVENRPGYRALLCVPLIWQGRVIGVLQVCADGQHRRFNERDLELLMLFANQAAIALETARLLELEEARVAQLEDLRQASLSLTARLDLGAVLNGILESALRLMPSASNGHIFLYHQENGGWLSYGAALWAGGKHAKPFSKPRPDGLTYTVARSGEPILVMDMQNHPLFATAPKSWHGSIIGLPLMIGSRVVGVMNISNERPDAFVRSDLGLLRLLGDQAAIAIENARLYEQVATERRHLGLLYEIGRELAPSLDKDEILSRAISLACKALSGTAGKAFLYAADVDRLDLRAAHDYPAEQMELIRVKANFKLGEGVVGWAAEHRQSINVPDIRREPRWVEIPDFDEKVRSVLAAPILHQEHLLGALSLVHPRPGAFSVGHLELLEAICQQVGLALSNVERYQEVQHLVDRLAAEQNRLKSLVEHLPVGVMLLDNDFRLILANSIGREIFTILESGEIGERLERLGPVTLDELVANHDDPLPFDVVLNEPVKKVFEVQTRLLEGDGPQWVLMIRDVTQERQDRTRIQMQERLATVGQLAAGIAHDFNNIMAAILVYTDLLRRDLNLYPAAHDRLAIIQQQVQRAASLIRQILDFSRRSVMEQSQLDLLPFIKELDKLLARVLPETIRLDLSYQPDAYLVNADPIRLQQVFMNLAVNARDAMPSGGALSFELGRLHLAPGEPAPAAYLPEGDWVVVQVNDTGCGISPEVLPHIFEPFFTTKPVGQGTGLGLAQAYGIIKQHDGYIDVRSQVDQGTSFLIYLPALPDPEVSPVLEEENPIYEGRGELILVVEDDAITREAIRDLLEVQNYRVLVAANGAEAVQVYEKQAANISLLISDIVMPEIGGVDLYNLLKARHPKVKFLFITGHPLLDENQAILVDSGISWLEKPFSVPDFSQAVKALLEER